MDWKTLSRHDYFGEHFTPFSFLEKRFCFSGWEGHCLIKYQGSKDWALFIFLSTLIERTSGYMSKVRRNDSLIHLTHVLSLHHLMKGIIDRLLFMKLHDWSYSPTSSPWQNLCKILWGRSHNIYVCVMIKVPIYNWNHVVNDLLVTTPQN